ncbi:MAG: hypothetical protein JW760_02675 [Spirochaetales bacterium]|nr:hypothetical protein [Spirochaetales bacterium]
MKGVRLQVAAQTSLVPGERINARVFFQGNRILFQTGSPEIRSDHFFMDAGIPKDSLSKGIIQAFQQSGLPLKPELIITARRLLEKADRKEPFSIRLLSLLLDKKIQVSPDALNILCSLDDDRGSRKRRQGQSQKKKEEENPETTDQITDLFQQDNREHPLHLFNHLKGSRDHWVLIPFNSRRQGNEVNGSLRLRLDKVTGIPLEMYMHCGTVDRDWWFSLPTPEGKKKILDIRTDRMPESGPKQEEIIKLRQKLHNLGVKVDDIKKVDHGYDGMSTGMKQAFDGIDTYA